MSDSTDRNSRNPDQPSNGDPLERIESGVRGYAKLFPAVFDRAVGSVLTSEDGRQWTDFFCGAGSLNYGHNNPAAKQALLDYITRDGIQHSLDTVTAAKVEFVETFENLILRPRGLDYRIQFTGPTGTNAVEAAIKLARQKTSRSHVVAFTNAYHGHSLGSLALTGNRYYHSEFYGSRNNVTHLPYDGYAAGVDSAPTVGEDAERFQQRVTNSGSHHLGNGAGRRRRECGQRSLASRHRFDLSAI